MGSYLTEGSSPRLLKQLHKAKGEIVISQKRRDKKHRVLRNGESQRADGRYAYKYIGNDGKSHFVYSWKLEKTDPLPSCKRDCEALREKEKRIEKELAEANGTSDIGSITVSDFVEKYIDTHNALRESTVNQYRGALNILKKYSFCHKKISEVTVADAKKYALELSKTRSFGTTQTDLIVLKAAFNEAVEDGILKSNPFSFRLSKLIINNTVPKSSINKENRDTLIDFCRKNKRANKSIDAITILLGTGMRISELCGLTFDDIDMKKRIVFVRHQLYKSGKEIKLVPPKSSAGIRPIPMSDEVYKAFERVISDRNNAKIPKYTHFLFLTSSGKPTDARIWDSRFRSYCRQINEFQDEKLPRITPHSCRHTFCSDMALDGMNLKILQKVMGHSSLQITADRYTHVEGEDEIIKEFYKIGK